MLISVRDYGMGVSKDKMPRMFERFFRAKSAAIVPGTGLGLCKKLVEMHGGDIRVESTQGEGSTFTVKLPIDARCQ